MTFYFIPEQADATRSSERQLSIFNAFYFLTTADTHEQYWQRVE